MPTNQSISTAEAAAALALLAEAEDARAAEFEKYAQDGDITEAETLNVSEVVWDNLRGIFYSRWLEVKRFSLADRIICVLYTGTSHRGGSYKCLNIIYSSSI